MVGSQSRQRGCDAPAGLPPSEIFMHLSRNVTLKLLKRQEWGRRPVVPLARRRGALSPARRRRFGGLSRP
jgi:hypothetical protein